MKKLLASICAGLAIGACNIAFADDSPQSQSHDQAQILTMLKEKFPSTHVDSIRKAEMGDLYEIRMGTNIAYVDKNMKYFLFGHIFDMTTQQDLTQARINEADKVDFAKLTFKDAIKVKKGNGKRVFAVFTDPECPYCKKLEESLAGVDNYTMYIFLYPLAELHPAAKAKAVAIWCSKDRAKAYHENMTNGIDETKVKPCATPLDQIAALGQSLHVNGTPTLIRADGVKLPGYAPATALNTWLDQGAKPAKAEH